MDKQEITNFRTETTPDPARLGFSLAVPDDQLTSDNMPVPGETTYEAFALGVKIRLEMGWAPYIFLTSAREGDGYRRFYFGPPISDEEMLVPFEQFQTTKIEKWDAVLEDLWFLQDDTIPLSGVNSGGDVSTAPRVFVRRQFRPEQVVPTRVEVKRYLSTRQFPRERIKARKPVPTEVWWDFMGSGGRLVCLHPEVRFPELQVNATIIANVGVVNGAASKGGGDLVFPATNFTDWSPYTVSEQQPIEGGYWVLEELTYFPPTGVQSVRV